MFEANAPDPELPPEFLPVPASLLYEVVEEVQGLRDDFTNPNLCSYDDPLYVDDPFYTDREQFIYVEPAFEDFLSTEVGFGNLTDLETRVRYDEIIIYNEEGVEVRGSVDNLLLQADVEEAILPVVRFVEQRVNVTLPESEPQQHIRISYYSAKEADDADREGGPYASILFGVGARNPDQAMIRTTEVRQWMRHLKNKRQELRDYPDAGA